jgi:hypothetical protein
MRRASATIRSMLAFAVIADEDNERAFRPAHVGKSVRFAVNGLERKVARLRPQSIRLRLGIAGIETINLILPHLHKGTGS